MHCRADAESPGAEVLSAQFSASCRKDVRNAAAAAAATVADFAVAGDGGSGGGSSSTVLAVNEQVGLCRHCDNTLHEMFPYLAYTLNSLCTAATHTAAIN